MKYEIKPAQIEEKEIIRELLQPYLTELARFPDEKPDKKDKNSTYPYPNLGAYWEEEMRFPYLHYADGEPAGFALVRKDGKDWHMAEFYVLPDYRRQGLGAACANEIFQKHPGSWWIGFNKQNIASRQFWRKLAQRLSKGDIKEGKTNPNREYIRFTV